MSNLLNSLVIASSGLDTQARRLNVVSQNIANVDTPGYRRKTSEFAGVVGSDDRLLGVKMVRIGLDDARKRPLPLLPRDEGRAVGEGLLHARQHRRRVGVHLDQPAVGGPFGRHQRDLR